MSKDGAKKAGPNARAARGRAADVVTVENLHGERAVVRLRVNPRARRLSLKIDAVERQAIATAPNARRLGEAAAFAQAQADWLIKALKRLPAPAPFAAGQIIPVRGVARRIQGVEGRQLASLSEDPTGAPVLLVGGDPAALPGRVRRFLQVEALGDLRAAVFRHSATLGQRPGPIRLRDTRSRWGSCAADGAMSFSWRLIFAPSFVLDYVAAHEVAHRIEMNHSRHFWAVVERLYGDPAPARDYLKRFGRILMNYGTDPGDRDHDPIALD